MHQPLMGICPVPCIVQRKQENLKKTLKAASEEASKIMTDAINEACSQQLHESFALSNSMSDDDCESNGDCLSREVNSACRSLQAEISKLTTIIQQQQLKIDNLENKLTDIIALLQTKTSTGHSRQLTTDRPSDIAPAASSGYRQPRQQLTAADPARHNNSKRAEQPVEEPNDSHFTLVVHRTLNDVSRRKKNVVVTGMAELDSGDGIAEKEMFEDLCERHLSIKPSLAQGNCCIRIGKQQADRPRRLLVKLHSDEAATAVLEAASLLRSSDDEYIASHVFINPDLSPQAAKLAYEARVRRREQQKRHSMLTSGANNNSCSNSNNITETIETHRNISPLHQSLINGNGSAVSTCVDMTSTSAEIETTSQKTTTVLNPLCADFHSGSCD
jgi:hypothetical protein